MDPVTLSAQFQLEVPQALREQLGLQPGEKFQVVSYGRRLEFIPVRPIQEMRGFLRGKNIDPDIESDEDPLRVQPVRPIQEMRGLLRGMDTEIERDGDRV